MEKIEKFLKERKAGLLLLVVASLIVVGFSVNSHLAQSENKEQLASAPVEEQVLGEMAGNIEEPVLNESEIAVTQNTLEEEAIEEAVNVPDPEDIFYDELKAHLKKYCGKNFNVKKCRDYLLEAKDARAKGARFKELYKKYHFVPKKVEKKDNSSNTNIEISETKEEATLTINYVGNKPDDKYTVAIVPSMTVIGMMDKANGLSYVESKQWAGYILEINGVKEDISKNTFWMLYYNGGMASEGASTLKVKSGDKIEWKYMEMIW